MELNHCYVRSLNPAPWNPHSKSGSRAGGHHSACPPRAMDSYRGLEWHAEFQHETKMQMFELCSQEEALWYQQVVREPWMWFYKMVSSSQFDDWCAFYLFLIFAFADHKHAIFRRELENSPSYHLCNSSLHSLKSERQTDCGQHDPMSSRMACLTLTSI